MLLKWNSLSLSPPRSARTSRTRSTPSPKREHVKSRPLSDINEPVPLSGAGLSFSFDCVPPLKADLNGTFEVGGPKLAASLSKLSLSISTFSSFIASSLVAAGRSTLVTTSNVFLHYRRIAPFGVSSGRSRWGRKRTHCSASGVNGSTAATGQNTSLTPTLRPLSPYSDTRQIRRPSRRQSASTQPIGFAQTRGLFEIVKRAQGRRDDLATRSLAVERIALAEG